MKSRNQTPKRKRLTKKERLHAAESWIKIYSGKNIISSYSGWFGVDKICAINELKALGIIIPDDIEKKIRRSLQGKNKKKKDGPISNNDCDENFALIFGYTSGGAPYGVTHEEITHYTQESADKNPLDIFT